jgi:hypothetical protein
VSDEDRNRFGVLLDHAAERGLLSSAEYQVRLSDLADATSVDEMQRIVTDLPAFGTSASSTASEPRSTGPSVRASSAGSPVSGADLDSALWAGRTSAHSRRRRGNPWVILTVVIVVLVVALVSLALVAAHVSNTHHLAPAGATGALLSRLHL